MSDRRFDVSGVQVTASVLAAVTGAVLASYLGVAGTIIGTAVMSVAGTAGTAIYKHYLGRTAGHIKETATVAVAHRAAEWMTTGTRTAAHGYTAGNPHPPGVRAGPGPPGDNGARADTAASGDTDATRGTAAGETAAAKTAAGDKSAAEGNGTTGGSGTAPAGRAGQADGTAAPRTGWLARWRGAVLGWPMWLRLAAGSAVVFAGVIGAVSVVEVATGKPLQTVVWNHKASGTTVGNLVGGRPSNTTRPARPHAKPSSTAPSSPGPASSQSGSATPSPSPSSSSPSPSPSPSTSTSSPPASSSPSPSPAGSGTAKAATG